MSTSKSPKPSIYLIVIDGLPEQYTWQDLKDFVRPEAEHEFWVDLKPMPDRSPKKKGCIRTQRWKEAHNLYKYLVRANMNEQKWTLSLWDITTTPKQIHLNPAQVSSEVQASWAPSVGNSSGSWSSIAPSQSTQQQIAASGSQAGLAQSMESLSLQQNQRQQVAAFYSQQQQQRQILEQQQKQAEHQKQVEAARRMLQARGDYHAAQSQRQHASQRNTAQSHAGASRSAPTYVNSQTGIPVNVSDGVVLKVSRGVFVSGINYKAREEDIKHKFSSCGRLESCELLKDSTTGRWKGVATLLFSSPAEAQKAVDKYDGTTWMDKSLKVRFDIEKSPVAGPSRSDVPPLIVNGSRV